MTDECLGFSSKVVVYRASGRVVKTFIDCPAEHWSRILKAWRVLSSAGIAPRLLSVVEKPEKSEYSITMAYCYPSSNLPFSYLQENMPKLVDKMHRLGYAHGDLHRRNIGFVRDKQPNGETVARLIVFDLDTAYLIDDPPDWVSVWMAKGFRLRLSQTDPVEAERAYARFVNSDYELWRTC